MIILKVNKDTNTPTCERTNFTNPPSKVNEVAEIVDKKSKLQNFLALLKLALEIILRLFPGF